jgi:hypothetical protein
MSAHPIEQSQRSQDIVGVIDVRTGDRFADLDKSGKVNDRLRFPAAEDGIEKAAIADVAPFERAPFDGPRVAVGQVVDDNRLKAPFRQDLTGMAADVAGPTGDGDGPRRPISDDRICSHMRPQTVVRSQSSCVVKTTG